MRAFRSTIAAFAFLAAAGCAHMRPEAAACVIPAYPVLVNAENHPNLLVQILSEDSPVPPPEKGTFAWKANDIIDRASRRGETEINALVLSGGSQHGLFGTGFLLGAEQRLPRYKIVTGISTGALQSTFAFLAKVPRQRPKGDYPSDLGGFNSGLKPPPAPTTSNLQDLALASSITHERTLLIKRPFGMLGGLVTGSVGSLRPLRDRIEQFIDNDTLKAIAAQEAEGRYLFVGVTDVDNGKAYALDMVQLARDSAEDPTRYRRCYADALVASSAVPLAAEPVSLKIKDQHNDKVYDHLFVDGGARYSVFARDLAEFANRSAMTVNFDVIVNGYFYTDEWVNKNGDPIEDWNAVNLSERVIDIVQNQVSRFSVDAIERLASRHSGNRVRLAFIDKKPSEDFPYSITDGQGEVSRSCHEWTKEDERRENPLEFHPRYMACLLAYGMSRGRGNPQDWDLVLPK